MGPEDQVAECPAEADSSRKPLYPVSSSGLAQQGNPHAGKLEPCGGNQPCTTRPPRFVPRPPRGARPNPTPRSNNRRNKRGQTMHNDPGVEDDALIRGRGKFIDMSAGVAPPSLCLSSCAARTASIATDEARPKMAGGHRHHHRCRSHRHRHGDTPSAELSAAVAPRSPSHRPPWRSTRSCMSAKRWRWWSLIHLPQRSTPPNRSRCNARYAAFGDRCTRRTRASCAATLRRPLRHNLAPRLARAR